jgi:hypothetical protein
MCVWEVASGKRRRLFRGHYERVSSVAYLPGGRGLVSGGFDATVLCWDLDGKLDPPAPARTPAQLWADLAEDGPDGGQGVLCALLARPGPAVALLRERLKPVTPADPVAVERLIARLDARSFAERQRAESELERLEELAEPALRRVLRGKPSLEVRRRVEGLLTKLERLRFGSSPEGLRLARAVEALERAGTEDSRRLLRQLAGGAPGARQTRDAKAALARLERR